jgi:predicted amidohydrolase
MLHVNILRDRDHFECWEHHLTALTLAAVQMDVRLADPLANRRTIADHLNEAHAVGADLTVFPDCGLTGYMFDSREDCVRGAVTLDGPEVQSIIAECRHLGMHAVVGLLERDEERVHNTAILAGPDGLIGVYRKRHLPDMGADRFTDEPSDHEIPVFDTAIGRIGILICYEIRFPEVARSMALRGADILALPTNWPMASAILADQFTRVRAAENMVHLVVANRSDVERGIQFLGSSQIISPLGDVVAHAGDQQGLIVAEVDLETARNKHISLGGGEVKLSPWDDRRPQSYQL